MLLTHSADRRGVTPVVGFVLLMGLVAVVVLGVFLVGTSLTGATQQTVEDRQASNSMSELATEIDRLATGDVDTGTFHIDGSDGSVTDVDPAAGRIQLAIEANGTRTQLYDEPIGSIQYQSDGTTMAYQAGGIWRSGEGSPVLVEPPRFDYRSSPSPTLTLPVISVQGDGSASGEFDGSLSVANRSDVFPAMEFDNPVSADRVVIDVQSEYCSAWGSYVDGQTDGSVVEGCSETINTSVDELRVELPVNNDSVTIGSPPVNTTPTISTPSVDGGDGTVESSTTVDEPEIDSPDDGPDETDPTVEPIVDPGDPTDSEGSNVYGLYVENGLGLNSLGGQVQGSLGAGGIVQDDSASLDINGSMDEGISSTRDPHDDEIQQILDTAEEEYVENFCGGPYQSCTISGSRTMIVDGSEFNGGGGQVTFDVSEGNVTLLVDGDLETEPYTQWEITGHESGHSVDVYSTGDLELGSGEYATAETDMTGFQPVNKWSDVRSNEYHPEALTFYATEDADVSASNSVAIEGSISAPGAGTGSSLDLRMVGAIYLGSWDVDDAALNLYPAPGSYGRPDGESSESNGTIEVTVTDANTSDSVPAAVDIYDDDGLVETGEIDGSGPIEFDVDPGSYRVVADRDGYLTTNASDVPVEAGGTTAVELPLAAEPSSPTTGAISGSVSNVSTGDSIETAVVEATYASNDTIAATAEANASGQFSMELPDGTYGLTARSDDGDYNTSSVDDIDVVAGADTDVLFELAPNSTLPTAGELSVTVENGTNDVAVAGAEVQIETSDGAAIDTSSTPSSGTVSVDDLDASSEYVVTVSHPEYDENTADGIPINATDTTDVTVPLRPEGYSDAGTPSDATNSSALYYLHVSETEIIVEE